MPITAEARAAQKQAWSLANKEKINTNRRACYHSHYGAVMSARGKLQRGPCPVCG
jgi:hypothetical protein